MRGGWCESWEPGLGKGGREGADVVSTVERWIETLLGSSGLVVKVSQGLWKVGD